MRLKLLWFYRKERYAEPELTFVKERKEGKKKERKKWVSIIT